MFDQIYSKRKYIRFDIKRVYYKKIFYGISHDTDSII
jgi:hypothetical protein